MTVAKAIQLKDKFENLGAKCVSFMRHNSLNPDFLPKNPYRLVIDVANKTNDTAGDGTTTATVLARAIYSEGVRNVAAGCNPMDLRRGTQKAVDQVISFLEKSKRVITTSDQIAQVRIPSPLVNGIILFNALC